MVRSSPLLSSPHRDPWEPTSSRPERVRRILPFVGVLATAVGLATLPPGAPGRFASIGLASVGLALTAALIVVVPWERLPDWLRLGPVVGFCTFVALTRDATGASRSGVAVVLLLAVVWQAVYGSRRHLGITLGLVFVTMVAPVVAVGGDDYPAAEWRKALLLTLVATVVGVVVQELVRQMRQERWVIGQLADLARAAVDRDARHEVCATALRITGADMAVLLEPAGDAVRVTGSAGVELPPVTLDADLVPALVHRALVTGERQVVLDTEADDATRGGVSAALGMRCWVHQPARGPAGDRVLDLAVAWRRPRRRLPRVVVMALPLVGMSAASTLDRADLVARLDTLAHRDPLTGLLNRRAWDDVVVRELTRAARTGRPLSVAVVDLDRFKVFNDAHGHLVGDQLLEGAAAAWTGALRTSDVLARWGGEEFAVLMPETATDEAERVLARMAAATPMAQTFSAGLVTTTDDVGPVRLMRAADAAVYRAKAVGRDRVERGDLGATRARSGYASSRSV